MDAFSEGFVAGVLFFGVLSGALLIVVSRSTVGGASEVPEDADAPE